MNSMELYGSLKKTKYLLASHYIGSQCMHYMRRDALH